MTLTLQNVLIQLFKKMKPAGIVLNPEFCCQESRALFIYDFRITKTQKKNSF